MALTALAFAVFLLACAGLLIMYSSGHDFGGRFEDHARNMPSGHHHVRGGADSTPAPDGRRRAAVRPGRHAVGGCGAFGITKKGRGAGSTWGDQVQPSEILKIAMPLMLAWWFQKREGQLRPLDFGVAAVLLAVPVALIVKQPDLGTALLILTAGMSVIFYAG